MQPLPSTWIEAIFTRMTGVYGSRFRSMWDGIDPHLINKTWATELAGFSDKPDAIKYALEHLPADMPPTALAFRKICNMAPDNTRALPAPHAPLPPAVKEKMGRLRYVPQNDPRAWARRIVAKHANGVPVTLTVLKMAKDALATEIRA